MVCSATGPPVEVPIATILYCLPVGLKGRSRLSDESSRSTVRSNSARLAGVRAIGAATGRLIGAAGVTAVVAGFTDKRRLATAFIL